MEGIHRHRPEVGNATQPQRRVDHALGTQQANQHRHDAGQPVGHGQRPGRPEQRQARRAQARHHAHDEVGGVWQARADEAQPQHAPRTAVEGPHHAHDPGIAQGLEARTARPRQQAPSEHARHAQHHGHQRPRPDARIAHRELVSHGRQQRHHQRGDEGRVHAPVQQLHLGGQQAGRVEAEHPVQGRPEGHGTINPRSTARS